MSPRFQGLIFVKELRPYVTIKNRNSYMGSPMAQSHLTLSDLERSKSSSLDEALYL